MDNTLLNIDEIIGGTALNPDLTSFGGIVSALLPVTLGLASTALLIFLVYSGFKYLTSAGDPKQLESAKGALTASIIGFFVIIVAFWLTQIVNEVFRLGAPLPQ